MKVLAFAAKFAGEWANDKAEGKGIYKTLDGSRYEGEWKNDCVHGAGDKFREIAIGREVRVDGSSFEGTYKEGKKCGRGVYISKTGCKYDGEWEENKMSGVVPNHVQLK